MPGRDHRSAHLLDHAALGGKRLRRHKSMPGAPAHVFHLREPPFILLALDFRSDPLEAYSPARMVQRIPQHLEISGIVEPKTDASDAFVRPPQTLAIELDFCMEGMQDKAPEAFVFASRSHRGTPIWANNFP